MYVHCALCTVHATSIHIEQIKYLKLEKRKNQNCILSLKIRESEYVNTKYTQIFRQTRVYQKKRKKKKTEDEEKRTHKIKKEKLKFCTWRK